MLRSTTDPQQDRRRQPDRRRKSTDEYFVDALLGLIDRLRQDKSALQREVETLAVLLPADYANPAARVLANAAARVAQGKALDRVMAELGYLRAQSHLGILDVPAEAAATGSGHSRAGDALPVRQRPS